MTERLPSIENTDGARSKKPMKKRKRLVTVDQVKQAINYDIFSGPETEAISKTQRRNKDVKAAVTISDSPLQASRRLRNIEATSDQVYQIMSDIQRRRTSESEYRRAMAS